MAYFIVWHISLTPRGSSFKIPSIEDDVGTFITNQVEDLSDMFIFIT